MSFLVVGKALVFIFVTSCSLIMLRVFTSVKLWLSGSVWRVLCQRDPQSIRRRIITAAYGHVLLKPQPRPPFWVFHHFAQRSLDRVVGESGQMWSESDFNAWVWLFMVDPLCSLGPVQPQHAACGFGQGVEGRAALCTAALCTRAHTPQKCRQSLCAELNTRKRHRLSVNHIKLLKSATSEEFVLFPWSSVSQKNNSPTDRHKSLALGLRCFHEFKRSPKHWDLQRWYLKPDSDLGRLDSFRLKQLETLIKCFSFSYFHPPSFHSGSIVLQCSYSWNALSALKRKQTETVTKKTTSIVLVKSRPKSSHEKVVFKEKQRI